VENGDEGAKEKLDKLKAYVWKYRRRRLYRYPGRYSPEKRKGTKFKSIMIHLETYQKIKELQKFYKAGMGSILRPLIDELFDKTHKEAELLARIEANRKKESETSDTVKPKRRTHF
jgi:predicted CopG family antitoxin